MKDLILYPDGSLRKGSNRSTDLALYVDANLRSERLYQGVATAAPPGEAITGNAALTSEPSLLVASGAVVVAGGLTITNGDSALSADGAVVIAGSAALVSDASELVASGALSIDGDAALVSDASELVASGALLIVGNASLVSDPSVLAASGSVPATGEAVFVNDESSLVASGAVTVSGVAWLTNDESTLIAAGVVEIVPLPVITGVWHGAPSESIDFSKLNANTQLTWKSLSKRRAGTKAKDKTPSTKKAKEPEAIGEINGRPAGSSYEWNTARALWTLGWTFSYQIPLMGGRNVHGGQVLDFLVNTVPLSTALLVNGDYWHQTDQEYKNQELMDALFRRGEPVNREPVILDNKKSSTYEAAYSYLYTKLGRG